MVVSQLKAPTTSTFTIKNLLRHYAKWVFIFKIEIQDACIPKDHNQWEALSFANQPKCPLVTPLVYLQAGSGQNFLFLYRGSWLVAADPLSNSLTYRMFQRSGAARTPDTCTDTWHVVNNDGTISQTSQARVLS